MIGRADPEAHKEYVAEYAQVDKRLPRFLSTASYKPWTTQSLLTEDEIKTCPVHNEFLRKHGVFHLMGATVTPTADGSLIHAALRHEKQGRFQADEIPRWLSLLPHIQRSVYMLNKFQGLETLNWSLVDVIDSLAVGVILLDTFARFVVANRYAADVLRDNDGLFSIKGELLTQLTRENRELHGLMAVTSGQTSASRRSPGGSMRVSPPSKKNHTRSRCAPCRSASEGGMHPAPRQLCLS